jgi:hypothetical protein
MHGKPARTCFKYPVYRKGNNDNIGNLYEPALCKMKLTPPPTKKIIIIKINKKFRADTWL